MYFVQTTADLIFCSCLIIITRLCFFLMVECPHSLSELCDNTLNSSDIVKTFQELSINIKRRNMSGIVSNYFWEKTAMKSPRKSSLALCPEPERTQLPMLILQTIKASWYLYYMYHKIDRPKHFVLPTLCSYICSFVWILEKTVIISLYRINWYVCINEGSMSTSRCELNLCI